MCALLLVVMSVFCGHAGVSKAFAAAISIVVQLLVVMFVFCGHTGVSKAFAAATSMVCATATSNVCSLM